jgi:hypothetical protein
VGVLKVVTLMVVTLKVVILEVAFLVEEAQKKALLGVGIILEVILAGIILKGASL